jgi:16S rRNA (adenine1518-N6/adenine1519-N6)-dimethyltransferase
MYSRFAAPRATIDRLQELGLYTKKSLGQHFLVDDNVVGRIIRLAEVGAGDTVIEIGPGIGTLTLALQDTGARLLAIECDEALVAPLREIVDSDQTTVVHADVLRLDAQHIQRMVDDSSTQPCAPLHLVSNLPYQVAATVVLRFFEILPALQSATVMMQREVADRISARAGTKEYGAYTIKLQFLAHVEKRFEVARSSFLPPPRVDSTVVRLTRHPEACDGEQFHARERVVDAAFGMRRKTLRNNLRTAFSAERVDDALAKAGIDGGIRAEMLEPDVFKTLTRWII